MKIVVFGATGMIGSRITTELEGRGHTVIAASRSTGIDVTDPDAIAAVASDADAAVSAVSARSGTFTLVDVAGALVEGVRRAGIPRLVVVGGAASLEVEPGVRLLDTPDFPDEYKKEAAQSAASLDFYRSVDDVNWTFVSPAASIQPGERTGTYRLGGDQLLVDDDGVSQISAEDFAIAIADLLEADGNVRTRVTAAW